MDLSNSVIDVSSTCDLSLVARDTVGPAKVPEEHRAELDLHHLHVCMILNPLDRVSDTTDSTTCRRMRPAYRVPEIRLR